MEIARQHRGEIHLLFTDMVMPKLSGDDLAAEIRRDRPAIKLLVCSGYTGDAAAQQGVLDPSIPFLQKPFTPRALAVKVREALDGSEQDAWAKGAQSDAARIGRSDPGVGSCA